MIKHDSEISVRRQCKLLGLNRSTIYTPHKDPDEEALQRRENIMARIDYWHTQMPAIGSRKIVTLVRGDGYQVGRKLVRKLMLEMGLRTIYPKENLSKRNFKEAIVPYLLRDVEVVRPNQVWSIDITFIKMGNSHMYLTAMIDWYSRKIVGHRLSDTLDVSETLAAVKEAVEKYGKPEILNSDQGSQYTSDDYKNLLKELGIRQSMDGRSRWADNIMIERWFRSLKVEMIYINEYLSPLELRKAIGDYITQYNGVRPHEALNNSTPDKVYASKQAA